MKNYTNEEYNNKYFKKNIDYLIKKHNITKSELDKIFEVGKGSISRYCKSDAPEPKIGIVSNIARYFDVEIGDLINKDLEEIQLKIEEGTALFYENPLDEIKKNTSSFCKKLIEETKEKVCVWHELDYFYDNFIEAEYEDNDSIEGSNLLEDDKTFISRFVGDSYHIDDLSIYTTMVDDNLQVLIIKLPSITSNEVLDRYELYLVDEQRVLEQSCASHTKESNDDNVVYDEVSNGYCHI